MTGTSPLRGDHDLDLNLAVGESRELPLASMGTAGFVWTAELEGDTDVVRVSRRRAAPDRKSPPGRSTLELLDIVANAPGRAVIRLQQARPWEAGKKPRASFAINVSISPAT
jgi:predicted secreted protein